MTLKGACMGRGPPGKAKRESFMPTSVSPGLCSGCKGVTAAGSLTEAVCPWEQPWGVRVQVVRDRAELTQHLPTFLTRV